MAIDSGYGKPDTVVYQYLTQESVTLADTGQRLCIIGPVNQVVEDSNVGAYEGDQTLYVWPDLIDGAEVDSDSVIVKSVKDGNTDTFTAGSEYTVGDDGITVAANIVVERDIDGSESTTGVAATTGISDPNADFLALAIATGDTVRVEGPIEEEHTVGAVLSETSIQYAPEAIVGSDSTTGVTASGSTAFVDATIDFVALGVEENDEIVITAPVAETLIVHEVTDEDNIVTKVASVNDQAACTFSINKVAPGTVQTVATYSIIKNDALGDGAGSEMLVTYVAARSDITSPIEVEESADVYNSIGTDITERNPMGLAASEAMLFDSQFVMMPTIGTDFVAFQNALASIEGIEVYHCVPLSMDNAIVELVEAHVDNMSDPLVKRERISYGCTDFVNRSVKVSDFAASDVTALANDFYQIEATGEEFSASNVVPGDLMYLEAVDSNDDTTNVDSVVVYEVLGNENIKVKSATALTLPLPHLTVATADFTKRQLAEYVRDVSDSIQNRRNTRMWCPSFKKSINGVVETVEGYYGAVAYAADAASNPSQKPMSKTALPGFESVDYSNLGYFSENDLDVMASGGVAIVIQRGAGNDPEIRHQLTTDMTSIKSRELSFTKNVDFLAKDMRSALEPYSGTYNITARLFDLINLSANSVFDSWKEEDAVYGPKVLSATLDDVAISETRADEIEAEVTAEVPLPNNTTTVKLYA